MDSDIVIEIDGRAFTLAGYIEHSHAFQRRVGRFTPDDCREDQRVLTRRQRRWIARHVAEGWRVPVVIFRSWLSALVDSMQAEIDRRRAAKGGLDGRS